LINFLLEEFKMGKRGRRLKLRDDEAKNDSGGEGGPERESNTRRPYDPFYNNCTFEKATLQEQLARTWNTATIEHLGITRHPISKGTGNLPQPVIRESNGTQLAVEALLRNTERQLIPIDEPLSKQHSPLSPLVPEADPNSAQFVPPYKRNGRIVVDFNEID
jgi:hypothetical protein